MFILEMHACRLAVEELTLKLPDGRSPQKEQEFHARSGRPTQVILKRPYILQRGLFNPPWGLRNGLLREETVRL